MSNPYSFAVCEFCGRLYCLECFTAENWQHFCSDECEEEYALELRRGND